MADAQPGNLAKPKKRKARRLNKNGPCKTKRKQKKQSSFEGNRTETKTAKLKLFGIAPELSAEIQATCEAYIAAGNYVSQYVFENGFPLSATRVQEKLYCYVRKMFRLKAQLACCVFRTVTARYKSLRTQLEHTPWRFFEEGMDEPVCVPRTLEWLRKPIRFRIPQCDHSRDRSYRFTADGKLSFALMDGVASVEYKESPLFRELRKDPAWRMGTGKVERHGKDWYFAIPFEREVAVATKPEKVVGVDRGLVNIVTTADESGKISYVKGDAVRRKRERFAETRRKLQAKGTWSAKRRLKAIDKRENRWMSDLNHRVSKALVAEHGAGTVFAIESLVDVSTSADNLSKRDSGGRRDLTSWAFYQLACFLTYKAEAAGAFVVEVDAAYTSQRCPVCGRIDKAQRHHNRHSYECACGHVANDDGNAALNILALGKAFLAGYKAPCFRKGEPGVVDAAALPSQARE